MPPESKDDNPTSNKHFMPGTAVATSHNGVAAIPDYEMLRRIGGGSYGEVWLVRTRLGTYRALKIIYKNRFDDKRPYERELSGISLFEPVSRSHEGFVDILHIGASEGGDWFYYVMELADDLRAGLAAGSQSAPEANGRQLDPATYEPGTLSALLACQGRLPVSDCVRLGLALTAALDHLHRHNLVHRDIKPSNIVFVNCQPRLADVGLVAGAAEAQSFVGTLGFIPPEGPGSRQADLYALGKVLYAASTGRGATAWPNPPTALEQVPDQEEWLELNEIILKACDPVPSRRYASAVEMHADLALIQSGKSLQRQRRLEKRLKQAGWALAAMAAAATVVLLVQQTRVRLEREWAKARQAGLESQLQVERERARAAEQKQLLLRLDREMRPPRFEEWSKSSWAIAAKAAADGFDTNLQSQAAATLAGLDANLLYRNDSTEGFSVAFDTTGNHVLLGVLGRDASAAKRAELLTPASGDLRSFSVPGKGPATFLPDGRAVQLLTDASNQLKLVVIEDQRILAQLNLAGGKRVKTCKLLAVTPGATVVAAGGVASDGQPFCAVWEGTSARLRHDLGIACEAVALSQDGSLLATGHGEGEVRIWNTIDGIEGHKLDKGHSPVLSLVFCRDYVRSPSRGEPASRWLLAVGDAGGTVALWEVPAGHLRARCLGAHYGIEALSFSPDGILLASGGRYPIMIWETSTGRQLLCTRADKVRALAFSPLGDKLASVAETPSGVSVWALENGRGIATLRGLASQITKVCFSSDSKLVAAVAHDWQVAIWDAAKGQLLHVFNMPRGLVTADNAGLAFSPDGRRFAFMSGTNAMLFETRSGSLVTNWRLPRGFVDELAFDVSGRLLAFHLELKDPEARLFTPPYIARIRELRQDQTDILLNEFPEYNLMVRAATWGPQGTFLVVDGFGRSGLQTNRIVKTVSPYGKEGAWALPSQLSLGRDPGLVVDSAGRLVCFNRGVTDSPELFEAESGKALRALSFWPSAMSSAGQFFAQWTSFQTIGVYSLSTDATQVEIQPNGTVASFRPVFSRDGRLLAWGNQDGTVSLTDLSELQRRLGAINLRH